MWSRLGEIVAAGLFTMTMLTLMAAGVGIWYYILHLLWISAYHKLYIIPYILITDIILGICLLRT